jgi:hypothetical protein
MNRIFICSETDLPYEQKNNISNKYNVYDFTYLWEESAKLFVEIIDANNNFKEIALKLYNLYIDGDYDYILFNIGTDIFKYYFLEMILNLNCKMILFNNKTNNYELVK